MCILLIYFCPSSRQGLLNKTMSFSNIQYFVLFTLFVTSANAHDCSKNYFENVGILNRENTTNAFAGDLKQLQFEQYIMVMSATVPVICEDAITGFPNLEKLHLTMLGIEEIQPGAFKDLPVLKELHIKMNKIVTIEENVFNNLTIEVLDLSGNKISYIQDSAFDNMQKLRKINLSYNKIKKIKKAWFYNTLSLSHLIFSHNQLELVQKKAFKHVKQQNDLILDLSSNRIEELYSRAFVNFKSGGQIDLSNNKLPEIPDDIFGNNRGGKFDLILENNRIKCVDNDVLQRVFLNCQRVLMTGNPISCFCSRKIEKFFERRPKSTIVIYEIDHDC